MNFDDEMWNFNKYAYFGFGVLISLFTYPDLKLTAIIISSLLLAWYWIILLGFAYIMFALFGVETDLIDSNLDKLIKYAIITIGYFIMLALNGFYANTSRNYLLIPIILIAIIFLNSTNNSRTHNEVAERFSRDGEFVGRYRRL